LVRSPSIALGEPIRETVGEPGSDTVGESISDTVGEPVGDTGVERLLGVVSGGC